MVTRAGTVPKVSAFLQWADHWGTIKARWGVGRMDYKVDPGLYAVGEPDAETPVFVTANYKMSFDGLRQALPGHDAWILVLDTKGINVWCAAGKGTFGTEELAERIASSGLARVVSHRKLILPQLAAPGVSAHLVPKLTGFKVVYGPVRAKDLPAFIRNGFKTRPGMRLKTFTARERAALVPIELVETAKYGMIILPILFLLGGLGGPGDYWANALNHGLFAAFAFLVALLAGAVLTPLLLPWLPGRAFSLKGLSMGLLAALILVVFRLEGLATWPGRLEVVAWCLLIPAVAAYLGMNFTGASTYTSLSGVKKEMRWAVPLEIAFAVVGLSLWIGSRFMV